MDYRLLGPVEVVADEGRRLLLQGGKALGLVALLALDAGRTVSAARLVDGLYRDPPPTVENALQQLVSKLRRTFAGAGATDLLVTRPGGYCLAEPEEAVDALRFEHLVRAARAATSAGDDTGGVRLAREALGLWSGEALGGATLEGESAGVRTKLAELRDAVTDDRVDGELRLGRHAALVPELEAMVAATPLREHRWEQLVVALYRCGRQSDALGAYRQARDTLAEELGVEPGPELRRLERAVLAHDAALAPPVRSPSTTAPAGQIRRARTACLGREAEIEKLGSLLGRPGLVTLVGPGGIGKTRLALEVADRLPAGACWVELAPVRGGGVPEAIGQAVGFDDAALAAEAGLVATLGRFLAARCPALVLDNCEHLVAEVAAVVADLLDTAPGLWILTTSREALGVPGEIVVPVPLLPLPTAVALFAERARAAGVPLADGDVTTDGPVAEICRSLDGLPLAVELAAARARLIGVGEIARRMDQRFALLTAGPRRLRCSGSRSATCSPGFASSRAGSRWRPRRPSTPAGTSRGRWSWSAHSSTSHWSSPTRPTRQASRATTSSRRCAGTAWSSWSSRTGSRRRGRRTPGTTSGSRRRRRPGSGRPVIASGGGGWSGSWRTCVPPAPGPSRPVVQPTR